MLDPVDVLFERLLAPEGTPVRSATILLRSRALIGGAQNLSTGRLQAGRFDARIGGGLVLLRARG